MEAQEILKRVTARELYKLVGKPLTLGVVKCQRKVRGRVIGPRPGASCVKIHIFHRCNRCIVVELRVEHARVGESGRDPNPECDVRYKSLIVAYMFIRPAPT